MAEFEKQNTQDKVARIIAEKLSIDASTITLDSTLQELGADSLDLVEIIMKLEEQFGIEVDDAKAETLKNVNDVVEYVHSMRSK
ncbi:acyl carrier protein [Candidatus Dependentiae bacterium]|nr:MAG: acyl carrier protein [Candidatus Dependentiae bacterium]